MARANRCTSQCCCLNEIMKTNLTITSETQGAKIKAGTASCTRGLERQKQNRRRPFWRRVRRKDQRQIKTGNADLSRKRSQIPVRPWAPKELKTEKGSHVAEKNQWQPNLTDAQTPYLPQKDEFWPEIKVNNEESLIHAQQKK
jgi:hypothetical protein